MRRATPPRIFPATTFGQTCHLCGEYVKQAVNGERGGPYQVIDGERVPHSLACENRGIVKAVGSLRHRRVAPRITTNIDRLPPDFKL